MNAGGEVYMGFIDHYENSNKGMGHYAQVLSERLLKVINIIFYRYFDINKSNILIWFKK